MKKCFLLTFLTLMIGAFFGSPKVAAQSKVSEEEYEIYSIVLNKMFEGNVVTFDTQTKIKQLVIKITRSLMIIL